MLERSFSYKTLYIVIPVLDLGLDHQSVQTSIAPVMLAEQHEVTSGQSI